MPHLQTEVVTERASSFTERAGGAVPQFMLSPSNTLDLGNACESAAGVCDMGNYAQ